MTGLLRHTPAGKLLTGILGCLLGLSLVAAPQDKAPKTKTGKGAKTPLVAGLPQEKALALGERMYREGLLPSGEPMESLVGGDIPVKGTSFSCVSCHLRSGLGSWEGGIVTLPINGARLAQERYWKLPFLSPEERKGLNLKVTQPARPPYTDQALAELLRTGIDPSGRHVHYAMPRYDLNDRDMAILIHYLRNLSAKLSPGINATTLKFATVITEEVSAEDEKALVLPIKNYINMHNQLSEGFGSRGYYSTMGDDMIGSYRKLAHSVWKLKGAPETWAAQLDAHLAEEPVFALLSGLTYGEWRPIHEYCESRKLPCLMPITDLPVVSKTDWYTQYFSKGYYQEGEAAARFLRRQVAEGASHRILQVVQSGAEGRDLANGFRDTWVELGQEKVREVFLQKGQTLTPQVLEDILQRENPTELLCWTSATAFTALEGLAARPGAPASVFMSYRLLGSKVYGLPEKARGFTWVTYPYRDPKEEPEVAKYAESLMAGMKDRHGESRIATRSFSMLQVLRQALMDMNRFFYRDNFMDRIGMQRDQVLPDYLRLSFGPGQRYASKGCYIMRVGPGQAPELIRESDWVIHEAQ